MSEAIEMESEKLLYEVILIPRNAYSSDMIDIRGHNFHEPVRMRIYSMPKPLVATSMKTRDMMSEAIELAKKYTTLNKIRERLPCESGWRKLLKHLGKTKADDESLPFETILESNGLDDALWCCRAAPEYDKEWRLFAVWCARQVQHLMKDQRSLDALDVAARHANDQATDEELVAAGDAAGAAAWAAARAAARAAAWAAASAAARAAAWAAARAAARAAAWAAASAAAGAAAGAAARAAQSKEFLRIVNGEK